MQYGEVVFGSHLSVAKKVVLSSDLSAAGEIVFASSLSVGKAIYAAEDITSASDRTFKINIQTLKHSLDRVKRLRGVTFEWDRKNFPKFSSGTQLGLIAQEVKEVLPEVVHGGENGNTLSLAYDKIVAILIESIKELD